MKWLATILILLISLKVSAQDKLDNVSNSSFTVTANSFSQLENTGVSGTILMNTDNITRSTDCRITMDISSGSFYNASGTIPAAAFRVTSANMTASGINFNPVPVSNVALSTIESTILNFRVNENNNGGNITVNYIVGGPLYTFSRTFSTGTYSTMNVVFKLYEGTTLRGSENFNITIRINGESIEMILNNPVINFDINTPAKYTGFSEQTANNQLTVTSTGNFTLQARAASNIFTGPLSNLIQANSLSIGVPAGTSGLGTINARQNISTTLITLLPSVSAGLDRSIPILYRFTPGSFLLNKRSGTYTNTITYTATQL